MADWNDIPDTDIQPGKPGTNNLFTYLRDNIIAAIEGAPGAPRLKIGAMDFHTWPSFLRGYGDGSDGAVTITSNTNLDPGMYQYTTLTINAGVALGLASKGILILRATTSITVNGDINVNGDGAPGGNAPASSANGTAGTNGNYGAGGAAGGGETIYTGGAGGSGWNVSGGAGDNNAGDNGPSLSTLNSQQLALLGWDNFVDYTLYGGAGGGSGCSDAGFGGDGGDGGGIVILIAPTITIDAAGSITANGSNGTNGSFGDSGGGGGGGGGLVVIASPSYTNNGTVTANGGLGGTETGGTAAYDGGDGGAGTVLTYS